MGLEEKLFIFPTECNLSAIPVLSMAGHRKKKLSIVWGLPCKVASANFICNLLLGQDTFFWFPRAAVDLDAEVKQAHSLRASYLSGAGYLEAELQLPGRMC